MSPTGIGVVGSNNSRSQEVISRMNRGFGICQMLKEENIRFILLAFFLYLYLTLGAIIFQQIEGQNEEERRKTVDLSYTQILANLSNGGASSSVENANENGTMIQITLEEIHNLLWAYGNATQTGALQKRRRWDFVGSFHFSWTIITTIGYGSLTPSTTAGKIMTIPYGFLGCAGGLLFFNLFLERIITFLAGCMRLYRIQRQKRRAFIYGNNGEGERHNWGERRSSRSSEDDGQDEPEWKPSVYWVMLLLAILSAIVMVASGAMFYWMEGWGIVESIYFCFVSYSTIGFGDYVSLQKESYGPLEVVYRAGAMICLITGCCCIYSLLNVTSIVIKTSLNWLIKKMDCQIIDCCSKIFPCCECCESKLQRRFSSKKRKPRRSGRKGSAIEGSNIHASALNKMRSNDRSSSGREFSQQNVNSSSDLDERRCSGENMISFRSELSNKFSLAVMQKRLYETAQMSRNAHNNNDTQSFSATSVGPLAIVTEKLGDNN